MVTALVALISSTAAHAKADESLQAALRHLRQLAPEAAVQFTPSRAEAVIRATDAVDQRIVELGRLQSRNTPEQLLELIGQLDGAKKTIDATLDAVLGRRTEFAELPSDQRADLLRVFLNVASRLIDLSGKVTYHLADAVNYTAYQFAGQPEWRDQLIDDLIVLRSSVGASIMAWTLIDPPASSPNRAQAASTTTKQKVLAMIAWSGRTDTLPVLAEFLRNPRTPPELVIGAAETVRQIGLPQEPRAGADPNLPPPPIAPRELQRIVSSVEPRRLSEDFARRRTRLIEWLDARIGHGVEKNYKVGAFEVRPGDWLLMRNASPYNLFTDLSPGLFTHVSVVVRERGSDGVHRMVVVEVTERGTRVPANNVESVLNVPLYYVFLRHDDPAIARQMGEIAASLIGNELEYDLGFNTALVSELVGQPLKGRKIKTYCAGLPLLCALETARPREEFFPIIESPASEKLVANLDKLGIRFGDQFVSPTGSLFSSHMQVIGRSDPMYVPGREIEQGIYDYAVAQLSDQTLVPKPNLFQSLREALAGASRTNPLLARALASAAGVNADTDLLTAARTATVLESLDQIASRTSGEFNDAALAVLGPEIDDRANSTQPKGRIERIRSLRAKHAELRQRVQQGQSSARQVTDSLVAHYIEQGKRQIDEQFFSIHSRDDR